MQKVILGKTGISVSSIGFGVLTMGKSQLNLPLDEGADLIRYALDQGINFFDTAQYYETYPYLKQALKQSHREPVLVSKCLSPVSRDMTQAIEEARMAMDRDVIDVFLLHEVRSNGDFEQRIGAWEALKTAKNQGLIKAMGISSHHADVVMDMADEEDCDVIFPLINKTGLGIRYQDGPGTVTQMLDAIEKNAQKDKGIFAMKVFGGGNLTGTYRECLDFVWNQESIQSMVIGFGKKEEIDAAIAYVRGRLAPSYQPDISQKKIHINRDDCEACGSCITRCPNQAIERDPSGYPRVNHEICMTCGYCAPVCPVRAIILY